MEQTDDLRVRGYTPLTVPKIMKQDIPISPKAAETVSKARATVQKILSREDKRLMVVVGPCSIHDEKAALEYAELLNSLKNQVADTLFLVMRVYFEKPRTTVGWKGLMNDPRMDGSCDMMEGLQRSRRLLMQIGEMGLPAATEMLDTITPQYLADLVAWAAIGARTTESQPHREMASGLSMPVGFKNSTDGNTAVVKTTGNPLCHIVLRGGTRPNYDTVSIEEARLKLIIKDLPASIMVDCSHGNSMKKYKGQPIVWENIIDQYIAGNTALSGLMLESNLHEGSQKFTGDLSTLKYGVSITDECISWETTESLLLSTHDKLKPLIDAR